MVVLSSSMHMHDKDDEFMLETRGHHNQVVGWLPFFKLAGGRSLPGNHERIAVNQPKPTSDNSAIAISIPSIVLRLDYRDPWDKALAAV